MSRAAAFFAIVLAPVIAALPAGAAEFGTRDEATAMVRRVQQKFKKEGPEAPSGPSTIKSRDLRIATFILS